MEPFREVFNPTSIGAFVRTLAQHVPGLDADSFFAAALDGHDERSLMQRSDRLYHLLRQHLPQDFPQAAALLKKCLHPNCEGYTSATASPVLGLQGWLVLPVTEFAGREGGSHLPLALELLAQCTMRFTSEFGIRHLWAAYPDQVMEIVRSWTSHENEHVRRLVSEGSRPFLPWGKRLPLFIAEPHRTLPLLHALLDDPSPYVRKSVANHLNDIARNHPELITDFAQQAMTNASPARQRLLRHALRNLLKKGYPKALAIYRLSRPQLQHVHLAVDPHEVRIGHAAEMVLDLSSASPQEQLLRIDLVVHFQKADGSLRPKVFRWKDLVLAAGTQHQARKSLSFRPITTRTYYPGPHRVEVQINGSIEAAADFTLIDGTCG